MRYLSILIPTYNDPCIGLVQALRVQADKIANLDYEILVADDASNDEQIKRNNRDIANLPNCRYIERKTNSGRSAIRNFLAEEARYNWLLFLDCELILQENFICNYIESQEKSVVVCGGVKAGGDTEQWKNNLRYIYETSMETSYTAGKRTERGYHSFRTTSFMIEKDIFQTNRFDENITNYGYEDVLFGKGLQKTGIRLKHIDNPVYMSHYENNEHYVEKTEEALRTLKMISANIGDFSPIVNTYVLLKRLYLLSITKCILNLLIKQLRTNICGESPKLLYFKMYKLGYYINL